MTNPKRKPYVPTTPFQKRMAQGHLIRTGHQLTGYYVPVDTGIVKLVRTCCDGK